MQGARVSCWSSALVTTSWPPPPGLPERCQAAFLGQLPAAAGLLAIVSQSAVCCRRHGAMCTGGQHRHALGIHAWPRGDC
ncbi:hypothetical protein HaLaN_27912, partial [Haematococcus lacustris]